MIAFGRSIMDHVWLTVWRLAELNALYSETTARESTTDYGELPDPRTGLDRTSPRYPIATTAR